MAAGRNESGSQQLRVTYATTGWQTRGLTPTSRLLGLLIPITRPLRAEEGARVHCNAAW